MDLANIIQKHYTVKSAQLSDTNTTWLVPNYQMGKRINTLIASLKKNAIWAPKIMTWSDWIQEQTGYIIPKRIQLLEQLYQVVEKLNIHTSFLPFIDWGSTLLNDFNEIDRYLIDTQKIFDTPTLLKQELERTPSSSLFNHFIKEWKHLPKIYENYRKSLLEKKWGYQGLLERKLYQQLNDSYTHYSDGPIMVMNLPPLGVAAKKILQLLSQKNDINCYYDVDSYYMEDHKQSAGYYLRSYAKEAVLGRHLSPPFTSKIRTTPPTIQTIATTTPLEQVNALSQTLQRLLEKEEFKKDLDEIAIVLGDESLLIPLLQALPLSLSPIKLLTGYPLIATSLYPLSKLIIRCYYAIQSKSEEEITKTAKRIASHPAIIIDSNQLEQQFRDLLPETPWHFLKSFLERMTRKDEGIAHLIEWEKKVLDYLVAFSQELMLVPNSASLKYEEALHIFEKEAQYKKMPTNHRDKGISIMNFSATISLTARWIFVLSTQEGKIPSNLPSSSLFPRSWRTKNGYPSVAEKESRFAYLFYRLLHNSDHLYFFYPTGQKGSSVNEKSRYLSQLIYESPLTITTTKNPQVTIKGVPSPPTTIPKSSAIQKELEQFLASNPNHTALTPSALNAYLDCPICFYFQYIARIPPAIIEKEDSVIDSLQFGQIFHETMDKIYRPYISSTITPTILFKLKAQILPTIEHVLRLAKYREQQNNHLMKQLIKTLVSKVLDNDHANTPFTLIGTEIGKKEKLSLLYPLQDGRKVVIGGIIDRVDRKGNDIRIVDYKTGNWQSSIPDMSSLFNPLNPTRNKIAMQLMTYCWLYSENYPSTTESIMPIVISSRTLFSTSADSRFWWKPSKEKAVPIETIKNYQTAFQEELGKVLEELFDPNIPFQSTPPFIHSTRYRYPTLCRGKIKN